MLRHGGAKGSRTPDLLNAIQTRYQLRYNPVYSHQNSANDIRIVISITIFSIVVNRFFNRYELKADGKAEQQNSARQQQVQQLEFPTEFYPRTVVDVHEP